MQTNSTKTYPIANAQLADLSDGIESVKRSLLAVSNVVCAAESSQTVLPLEDVSTLLEMLESPVDQLSQQITAIRAQ